MTGWRRPDVVASTRDHLAQVVGPTSAQQMVDGLIDLGRRQRDEEVEKLQAELAKYVGHEPTLAEEALYEHEQQVRARIAREVNRADKPAFAVGEDPELVVKTTRAIDIRLIELGPAAPYWVPEGGEPW